MYGNNGARDLNFFFPMLQVKYVIIHRFQHGNFSSDVSAIGQQPENVELDISKTVLQITLEETLN